MIDLNEVEKAIEKASSEIKDLLFSPETGENLFEMAANTYSLDEETTKNLVDEVGYVILGLKQRFSFADSLIKIGIDKNIASKITEQIEKEVFLGLDKIQSNQINVDVKDFSLLPNFEIVQKVTEISQKYSLNDVQKKILENNITSGSISNLKQDLSVSDIVASQIQEEINNRFFKKVGTPKVELTQIEIAPNSLPAIEPGQVAHTTPAFSVSPKPISQPISQPVGQQSQQNVPLSETKISVPRYIAPADDEATSPASTVPHNLPGQEVTPEKKYVTDPYREPIQ